MRLAYLSIGRHIHTERWLGYFVGLGCEVHLLTVQPGPMPGVTVHDITTPAGPKPLRYALSLDQGAARCSGGSSPTCCTRTS